MRPTAAVTAAFSLLVLLGSVPADARKKNRYDHEWEDRHDRWENRRDARRAGVVAGVVASGIASSAAASRADEHYTECMMDWG